MNRYDNNNRLSSSSGKMISRQSETSINNIDENKQRNINNDQLYIGSIKQSNNNYKSST